MNVLGSNFRFKKLFDPGYTKMAFLLDKKTNTLALPFFHLDANLKEDYYDHEN